MPPVIVPNCAEIVLGFACPASGYSGVNVLHEQYTGPPLSAGDVNTLATNAAIAWEDTFKGNMASDCTLVSVQAKDIGVAFGAATFINPNSPGTLVDFALPQGVGALVRLNTSLSGRPFRGRMFLYGTPQSSQDATNPNALTAGAVSAYQANITDFISELAGQVLSAGIANLGVATIKSLVVSPQVNDVISGLAEGLFAYQRRRAQR